MIWNFLDVVCEKCWILISYLLEVQLLEVQLLEATLIFMKLSWDIQLQHLGQMVDKTLCQGAEGDFTLGLKLERPSTMKLKNCGLDRKSMTG